MARISKDQYYLNIAKEVATRATCLRSKNGAVIVRDDQIVSTGYCGAPRGTKDCLERGECLRDTLKIPHGERYELCRSVHAEQNALINAGRSSVSFLGGTIYIHTEDRNGVIQDAFPCFFCKRMIINAGLKRVVCGLRDGKDPSYITYDVAEWVKEWQTKDIVDDTVKYQFHDSAIEKV